MQHQIILSLGSNQGNRIQNLENALLQIHQTIGTVIRVSPVYETPSWGFDSDSFYNCSLLVHSHFSAIKILQIVLSIEEKLGRIRSQQSGYSARIIDIDIIAFNEEVYDLEELQIPHPLMQQRKFVLQPCADLQTDWIHPQLNMNFHELLALCKDPSSCTKTGVLSQPLDIYNFQSINFLAIEGNIGAGKTTLAHKIAEDFNAKLILEGFADNPFLPKFYKDNARYAFPLEMSFLADRYSQLSDDLGQFDLFKEFIISDYYIFKSLIFSKITLEEDEYLLYKQVFDIMYKKTPKPDLYIYLYQNTDRLLENIQKRGRSYESDIPATYLDQVNQGYFNYVKTLPEGKVLVIDISDLDFVENQKDYLVILNAIQQKLK